MKINKQKLKYRIMATVVVLSVLLSYVAVFVVDSHAAAIDTMPSDYVYVATFHESNGNAWQYYVDKQYFDLSKNCFYKRSDGTADFLGATIPNAVRKYTAPEVYYETVGNMSANWFPWYFDGSSLYVFSDKDKAESYIAGTLSEADLKKYAINYDEIQESSASYDSSIPVPVKANVNVITASTVSSMFEYDENELRNFEEENNVELQYDYEVEYFYQLLSKSQINNQNSNLEVAEINRGVDDFALDKNNLFVAKITCKEQFEAFQVGGTPTTQKYLCTADSGTYKTTGIVELNNAVTSSPPDYYTLYTIPFSVFSMEYHMQFIAAQVRVTTYYVDDSGVKHKSDDVYFRRCLWSKDNDHYGATYTRIAKDDNGDDVFKNSYEMNSNGDDIGSDLGNIDDGNILQHIKNGFGLTGSDGYIELSNRFFSTVPSGVWSIIMYALAVSVVIIIFKSLRGM